MTHRLILLRHSLRQAGTDALSPTGVQQSSDRAAYFNVHFPVNLTVYVSPKQRCQESMQEFCRIRNVKMQLDADLTERGPSESPEMFEQRISDWVIKIENETPGVYLICSHSDWLYSACQQLADLRIQFQEGGWAVLEKKDEEWSLIDLVATEKDFQNLKPKKAD